MGSLVSSPRTVDRDFNTDMPDRLKSFIEWRHISAICDNPVFYDDIPCVCDIKQGMLGNCYFVSALYSFILYYTKTHPEHLADFFHVICPWQSFGKRNKKSAGLFYFNLWNGFAWHRVYVDDRLPYSIINGEPVACYNTNKEFWPMLLEKAIIKFTNSSFKSIDEGGIPHTVLRFLFSARLTSTVITNPSVDTLVNLLTSDALCTAAIISLKDSVSNKTYNIRREVITDTNLATNHAFCVFPHDSDTALVLNPWQNKDYRDQVRSAHHSAFCSLCKDTSGDGHADDGRWLMFHDDVVKQFNALYVINIYERGILQPPKTTHTYQNINMSVNDSRTIFVNFVSDPGPLTLNLCGELLITCVITIQKQSATIQLDENTHEINTIILSSIKPFISFLIHTSES